MSSRTRRTILDQSDAREMFDALLLHWGTANIAAQAAHQRPIVLAGNYGRNAFLNDAVAFDHLGDEIAQAGREREAAAEELTRLKVGMRGALESLSHFVHGHFAGADLSRKFPALPDVRSAQERVMNAMTRANEVWAEINHLPASAFEGPLVLNDGTTQREFAAGLRLLERAFAARTKAVERERILRADRRKLHKALVARAVQYRRLLFGLFPADAAVIKTFPYLWPKQERSKKTRAEAKPQPVLL